MVTWQSQHIKEMAVTGMPGNLPASWDDTVVHSCPRTLCWRGQVIHEAAQGKKEKTAAIRITSPPRQL